MNKGLHSITPKNRNYSQNTFLPFNFKQEDQAFYQFPSKGAAGNAFRKETTYRRYNSTLNDSVRVLSVEKVSITGLSSNPIVVAFIGNNTILLHDRGIANGPFIEYDYVQKKILHRVNTTFAANTWGNGICINNKVYPGLLDFTIPLIVYDTLNHRIYNTAGNRNGPFVGFTYIPSLERIVYVRPTSAGAAQFLTLDINNENVRSHLNHTNAEGFLAGIPLPDGRVLFIPNEPGDRFLFFDTGKDLYTYSRSAISTYVRRSFYFNGLIHMVDMVASPNVFSTYDPYNDSLDENFMTSTDRTWGLTLHPNGKLYGFPATNADSNFIHEYDPLSKKVTITKIQVNDRTGALTLSNAITPEGEMIMTQQGGGIWLIHMSGATNYADRHQSQDYLEY